MAISFLIAWMYGFWSSKKTLILLTALTAAALFGFTVAGDAVVTNRVLLYTLLVVPIWGINTVTGPRDEFSLVAVMHPICAHSSGVVRMSVTVEL